MITIDDAMQHLPLIAILRGVKPGEVAEIGQALYENGFRCIEVPLNSPDPFTSIAALTDALPDDCITGAGTVLTVDDVERVAAAGGRIIVSPNFERSVVESTLSAGMISLPGVGTPTEAFAAVDAGASWLKVFPAATYGSGHITALASVLPKHVRIAVTGGVSVDTVPDWRNAGAAAFGIGSELYRAGDSVESVREKAAALQQAAMD